MDDVRLSWARVPVDRTSRREIAWRLLRELLAAAGFPDAVLTNPCGQCGGPHGPVHVNGAPWRASVSYAGGLAVAGIGASPAFGIDAEPVADAVRDAAGGVSGGLLHWVRAEAVLKADGRGIRVDPADVTIAEYAPGRWTARLPATAAAYSGAEVSGPPGLLTAVAVASP